MIILNSLTLALDNPTSDEQSSFLATIETIFLVLYTVEMFFKIFGLGFIFNKGAYLRDSWNILDFIIVVSAYIPLIISSGSMNL